MVVLAAACGSSGTKSGSGAKNANTTVSAGASASTTTTTPAPTPAADLATAKAAVLTPADLPGYTPKAYSPSNDLPASIKKQFSDCTHEPTTIFDDTPGAQIAHSPDFDKGDATVSGEVEIDPTKADVDKGWGMLSKAGIEPCLQQLFESAVKASAPDATFSGTLTTRFDPGVGDRSVGYSIKLTFTAQGTTGTAYVDLLGVARDRAGIDMTALNIGTPLDRTMENGLLQKMYDRVGDKAA